MKYKMNSTKYLQNGSRGKDPPPHCPSVSVKTDAISSAWEGDPTPKIEPPSDLDGLGWLVLNPTMAKTDGVEDAQL